MSPFARDLVGSNNATSTTRSSHCRFSRRIVRGRGDRKTRHPDKSSSGLRFTHPPPTIRGFNMNRSRAGGTFRLASIEWRHQHTHYAREGRRTCFAGLSSRSPLNDACRRRPSAVHARWSICATIRGWSHWTLAPWARSRGLANGDTLDRSACRTCHRSVAVRRSKPVPTRPAYTNDRPA